MRRVLVLGNAFRHGVREEADRLLPILRQHAEVALVDLEQVQDISQVEADLVLVLGGDGAILRAARKMAYRQFPILGVNLGRLGFLADLGVEEFVEGCPRIMQGEYKCTEHVMYEVIVRQPGAAPQPPRLGLNEVAIQTGPPFHLLDLDLIIDGEVVARYSGDGLLVSTPIGSTAHGLSAGGPILSQELAAFAVTPICAFGLTSRPVVDSADKVFVIAVRRATSAFLVLDGQENSPLPNGAEVFIRRAPVNFKLARVAGRSFYRTLRDKLHWGAQPNFRDEPPRPGERTAEG